MKKTLTICLLLLFPSLASADVYSLCVGVNKYALKKGKKDQYGPDAHEMAQLLRHHGAHSKELCGVEATLPNVEAQFKHLANVCKPTDVVFIFFSTHGGTSKKKGVFSVVLNDKAMKGDEIAECINNIKGKVVLVLDTCGAGGMLYYEVRPGICILSACTDREGSVGGARKPLCGFFASAVYQGLKGRADYNHNGVVDLQELCRYVRDNRHVRGANHQHVQIENKIGNIPLVRVR